MRVAFYVRVSTERQQQAQTIEQQVSRLQAFVAEQAGWSVAEEHIFRDDGRSGAQLNRPGLDALRDQATHAAFDLVLMTAPDRLARNYVHQMIVLEELERSGCRVHFIDRPLRTDDPHEQLVLQIRGAVAEYERTLIADRMRRGRLAKLQSGQLLPWTHRMYGYRLDPERPRDPAGVQLEPAEAAIVQEIFERYAPGGVSLYALARRLTERCVPSPMGRAHWNPSTVRGILTNPAYMGLAASGKTRAVRAERRWSALRPIGRGESTRPRPPEEWIQIPVPAIVSAEQFARVQEVLVVNQQRARRNVKHEYLLRGLVSCGSCQLACRGSARDPQVVRYRYYVCRGKQHVVMSNRDEPCTARFIPALQLDELVWADLCQLLQDPQVIAEALERARSGAWLPEELRRRQASLRQVWEAVGRQRQRLLDAYLAGVIELATFQAKDGELCQRQADLQAQVQEIAVSSQRLQELQELARSAAAVGARLRVGLEIATAAQRRQLVELLIDRVVVTDGEVEIRYVIPLTEASTHSRFCQLRTDYLLPFEVGKEARGGGRPGTAPGHRRLDHAVREELVHIPPGIVTLDHDARRRRDLHLLVEVRDPGDGLARQAVLVGEHAPQPHRPGDLVLGEPDAPPGQLRRRLRAGRGVAIEEGVREEAVQEDRDRHHRDAALPTHQVVGDGHLRRIELQPQHAAEDVVHVREVGENVEADPLHVHQPVDQRARDVVDPARQRERQAMIDAADGHTASV